MAGKSPALAVQNYIDPIRKALSCVTPAVIQVGGGYSTADNPHLLTLGADPVPLSPKGEIRLLVDQNYEIVRAKGVLGPWKVHTLKYIYALYHGEELILSYHWHPDTSPDIDFPHLHHPASPKVHFPTKRIALEDVIRLAIREFGVMPLKKTWQRMLRETQGRFETYQTWR
jgi:hypothetical protein